VRNSFRLNFSTLPEDRIGEGIRRLGLVLTSFMAR
jgi:DNA-binding transcriptional MocR family regulator